MSRRVVDEHFVPQEGWTLEDYLARGERTPVHHLIRYRWAEAVLTELLPPGPLLDIACGAGYGSFGIASRFPDLEVVGGDYDGGAIEFARDRYVAPNLSFVKADVTDWRNTLGERRFGCIVSFDTIEHVEHREIMMRNVVEHLLPEGFLIISTPVRGETVLAPGWEHHRIEYSRHDLYDFVRRYFGEVLASDLGTLPCEEVFELVNRDEPVYLLKMNPILCRAPIRVELGR